MTPAKLCRLLLVWALLLGSGAHLAVLQSCAWAAMTVSNFKAAGSVSAALERTFDGLHPCSVCLKVKNESQSRKKTDVQRSDLKLDLFFARARLAPPASAPSWPRPLSARPAAAVPLSCDPPPPRRLLA